MKCTLEFVLVWLLYVSLSLFTPTAESQTPSPAKATFSLSIKTAEQSVKTGFPIRLGVTLTNTTDHEVILEDDVSHKGEFYYTVTVSDPANSEARRTDYHRALRGESTTNPIIIQESPMRVRVKAGGTLIDVMDITELYDLSLPGKYTIQLQRTDPSSKAVVKSNTVVITITKQ